VLDGELAPEVEVDVGPGAAAAQLADAAGSLVGCPAVAEQQSQAGPRCGERIAYPIYAKGTDARCFLNVLSLFHELQADERRNQYEHSYQE
jgi:hypothetical protein